jgi:phosphatidylglycerophosphatase A
MIPRHHFLWARMMPGHWVINLATLFGAGKVRWAPGTVGAAIGVLWYVTVFASSSGVFLLLFLLASLYFAAGICGEAALRLGKKDPGEVILDEAVVMPICFLGLDPWIHGGYAWAIIPLGFGLFRLFDITKPWLIRRLERMEGGWGILMDDVGAAAVTCVILHLLFSTGWVASWFA